MHTRVIFILEWKEGEIGKQRERQRESVFECGSHNSLQRLSQCKWIFKYRFLLFLSKTDTVTFRLQSFYQLDN